MKILFSKKRNFDKQLDILLIKRKNKLNFNSSAVTRIIKDVKRNGDKALLKYEKKFNSNNTIIPNSNKNISPQMKLSRFLAGKTLPLVKRHFTWMSTTYDKNKINKLLLELIKQMNLDNEDDLYKYIQCIYNILKIKNIKEVKDIIDKLNNKLNFINENTKNKKIKFKIMVINETII